MSSPANNNRKRKRRGVTRRTTDAEGNVIIKRYKRRESSVKLPSINPLRVPSFLLGAGLAGYAGYAYLYGQGKLSSSILPLATQISTFFSSIAPLIAIFATGVVAIAIGVLFGWSLMSKGFRIRKYPSAWRQVFAAFAVLIILSAIISPFINEPGKVRQQANPIDVTGNYDLSGLSSPFYSQLLDGLLNLLGNIPKVNANETVAYIHPGNGVPFNSSVDQYLYRWQVSETYSTTSPAYDYKKAYDNVRYAFSNFNPSSTTAQTRPLEIQTKYQTITSSYTGDALSLWNSEFGSGMDTSQMGLFNATPTGVSLSSNQVQRDINEQPQLNLGFSKTNTTGFATYNDTWIAENKDGISNGSVLYSSLSSMNNFPSSRFGSRTSFDAISKIWGAQSLPGGSAANYIATDTAFNNFAQKYNQYLASITPQTTVYDLVLTIYNDIANAVLAGLAGGLNIDPTTAKSAAVPGTDKALYFYHALANNLPYGIQDLIAGFVNMLRCFDIPARPVIGFSVGNFVNSTTIELKLKDVHVWVETLIPWVDSTSTTHYSWGIFNPVPDPYIFQSSGKLVYGQNALGGAGQIHIRSTSGTNKQLPNNFAVAGQTNYSLQPMGNVSSGIVTVSYNDIPASNQPVSLRLLTTTEMNSLDMSNILSTGISLGLFYTNKTNNEAHFRLEVSNARQLFRINDDNSLTAIKDSNGQNVTVNQVNALAGTLAETNVYSIVAFLGYSYNFTLFGWNYNGQIAVTVTNKPIVNIPDPINVGNFINSAGVIPHEDFTIQLTLTDLASNPIQGETQVQLYIFNETAFNSLSAQLLSDPVGAQATLDANNLAPANTFFPATDVNGQSIINYYFNGTEGLNQVMDIIGIFKGSSVFNNPPFFVYLSNDLKFNATLNTFGPNTVSSTTPVSWTVGINALEFTNSSYFTARPASGAYIGFYAIQKAQFDTISGSWSSFNTYIQSTACSITPGAYQCFYFDPALSNNKFNITYNTYINEAYTNTSGGVTVNLKINNQAFPVQEYYIVAVSTITNQFSNTSMFIITSPPPLVNKLSTQNVIKLNNLSLSSSITNSIANIPENYNNPNIISSSKVKSQSYNIFMIILEILMQIVTLDVGRRFLI